MMNLRHKISLILVVLVLSYEGLAQISPGDLAKVHAHLEGMANCTQCHTLGDKVSNDKCLDCHKEIKERIMELKGFHSSSKVKSKNCVICHSDHYGRNFDIVHLQKDKFDHADTGYKLEGKHAKKECFDCHKNENIKDAELKKKKETFLGLSDQCVVCHEDVHQKTLSQNCLNCHNYDTFKSPTKFEHSKAKFQLKGKHTEVACDKCHIKSVRNGKSFQQFSGLLFQNCVNCHKDPHENKFGQNCKECHTEVSFKTVRNPGAQFDHSKTGYPLLGKHSQLVCKLCHKISITAPVAHEKCSSCHKDYHNGQFRKNEKIVDCAECHDVNGFSQFSFSIEKHNQSKFRLEGSHVATPCFECHKKGKEWSFRGIGEKCSDCHADIHKNFIDAKYYPAQRCENCHQLKSWSEINFDHQKTSFALEGKHALVPCRKCHFENKGETAINQKFNTLTVNCENCHLDVHQAQFRENGDIVCARCHNFENWIPDKFNHDSTRFKLEGGHKDVACIRCHQVILDGTVKFIKYKFNDISCATCHLH